MKFNSLYKIKLTTFYTLLIVYTLSVRKVGINIKKSLDVAREIMDIVCMDCIILQHITILIF